MYAGTNDQLAELTGPGNKENFTMKYVYYPTSFGFLGANGASRWHCRDILSDSQKDIEIIGPVTEGDLDKVVMRESDAYWSRTRK